MSVVTMQGMDELKALLRQLPAELTDDADTVVREAADQTAAEIKAVYDRHRSSKKGNKGRSPVHLADSVVIQRMVRPGLVRYRVRVTAPHAHLFEYGTYRAEANPTLVPAAIRQRSLMVQGLIDLMRRRGFEVSGV